MRDGYEINGVMGLSRGGLQLLNLLSHRSGGYADPSTQTANTNFGFDKPITVLYFERRRKTVIREERLKGDAKFTQKRATLIPDPEFNLFTCFSRQGGKK